MKEGKVQFGKYKGKPLKLVLVNDPSYADWLAKHSNSMTKTKREMQSLIDTPL